MLGISPVVVEQERIPPGTVTGLGGGGATTPVVGISPARATPESTHARATANAKRLIVCFSFEDASRLARKHDSVNTYKTIDTASRAVTNIRWFKTRTYYTH